MKRPPRFLYFDLGKVLLHFDHLRAARQMAELSGAPESEIYDFVFGTDLEWRYEAGELTCREFYDHFCQVTQTSPDFGALRHAAADIFELNVPIVSLVAGLKSAGHRLGVLSNTNRAHWDFVYDGRYSILRNYFDTFALSFEIGSMKPDPEIYEAASELAKTPPEEIFFVDDRLENVEGAREYGFDATIFTTAQQLSRDLRARGIRFNA